MNTHIQHLMYGLLTFGALIGFGCDLSGGTSASESQGSGNPTRVFAVNFPLQSFAQSVGGAEVTVDSPARAGASALTFDPTPEQIIGIQDARLILLNGADFASWTANASLPSSRTIITANGFRSQWLESTHHHHDHDHQHGPEGEGVHHHHAHWASYTWLDPNHARAQATAVIAGMQSALSAQNTMKMRPRAEALITELSALTDQAAEIRDATLPPVISSESVYQYFAAACGLDLHEADWHWNEPEPHGGMQGLRNLIEATGARHLLVPEVPTKERLEVLRGLGLEPVLIMPLADPPSPKNTDSFSTLMKQNLDRIQALGSAQSAD